MWIPLTWIKSEDLQGRRGRVHYTTIQAFAQNSRGGAYLLYSAYQ